MARWEDGMLPEVEQAPEVGSPRQNESNWSNKAEQVGGAPPSPLLRSPGPSSHSRSSLSLMIQKYVQCNNPSYA